MDNLSSSELDSPSKTPFFIAIAAVIVGLVGLWLGWMGFSKANELESRLAELENASRGAAAIEDEVRGNTSRLDQVVGNLATLSQNVSDALSEVSSDVSKVRSDVRKVAIDAGTAKKMVEDLESRGVAAVVSNPASRAGSGSSGPVEASSPASKTPDAPPGKSGVYTIKSGDTLGRIAAAYKITLSELQAANPGVDARRLRIGQQIVVPAMD